MTMITARQKAYNISLAPLLGSAAPADAAGRRFDRWSVINLRLHPFNVEMGCLD
jgi:hypothetical protein